MISRVDGPGSLRPPPSVRKSTKTSGAAKTSFSKHLEEADDASGPTATGSIGSVCGVLNIQEVDDALSRASRGKVRAEEILDHLDGLKLDLLTGSLSRAKLETLAIMVNTRRADVTDPRLGQILDEIDLRAQVELAKFNHTENN